LVASNALISGIYTTLGYFASEQDWLAVAVCVAIALPGLFTWMIRNWQRKQ
jgi:hypothetical protein